MTADKSYVSGMCWLLTPMQRMTSRIEGDHIATIHHVIPSLCGIERHLSSIPKQPSALNFPQSFCDETLKLLEKRLGFVVEDEHLLAASVLSAHGLKWVTNAPRRISCQQILAFLAEDLPQGESLTFQGSNPTDVNFEYRQPQTQNTVSTW